MKILFISHYCQPHVGGVEKHVERIGDRLQVLGNDITIIAKDHPIKFPHIKYLGLIKIWWELFKLRDKIKNADIVHINDVFIWYLPFRFLYPRKKVYTTFHGGQDKWPVPVKDRLMVKMAGKLTNGNICVGDFIPKYYKIKSNYILYGGTEELKKIRTKKEKNSIVWVGRLDKSTDLPGFLQWLSTCYRLPATVFVGDGELREECEKFGLVTGFVKNPEKYLKTAETVVPVGYLSYLEAKNWGCKIKTFPSTPIKRDYWKGIKKLKKIPTWEDVVMVYLKLWS